MNRLYYNDTFPNIWMVVLKDLTVTNYKKLNNVICLYNNEKIIGYNLLDKRPLSNGFSYIKKDLLLEINKQLPTVCDKLELETNKIVVGLIEKILPIEKDAKLCEVNVGNETIQIVTIANNVNVAHKVLVALPGSVLGNGDIVNETVIYGYKSKGMFASKRNLLKVNEDMGQIIILGNDAKIGDNEWEKMI